jgi:prevent-host-death family protein
MVRLDIQSNFPPEIAQITVRELARNTAQVLARVGGGETLEVTRNGEPVAMLSPPDIEEVTIRGLIKVGILPPDWRERQAELKKYIRDNPPLPAEPHDRPLSETVIEMREDRF